MRSAADSRNFGYVLRMVRQSCPLHSCTTSVTHTLS